MSDDTPRGIRNNNPMNIEYSTNNPWQGAIGRDGPYVQFSSPMWGIRAGCIDLLRSFERDDRTLEKIMPEYAPPEENPTAKYIAFLAKKLGVKKDDQLQCTTDVIEQVTAGIIEFENGQNPYDPGMLKQAVRMAFAHVFPGRPDTPSIPSDYVARETA